MEFKGTNKSLSYLQPESFLFDLIVWFSRTQDKTLHQQLDEGVNVFDIQVAFTHEFSRVIYYSASTGIQPQVVFDLLQRAALRENKKIYVRLSLKYTTISPHSTQMTKFLDFCKTVEGKYTNLVFYSSHKEANSIEFNKNKELPTLSEYKPAISWLSWWPWLEHKISLYKGIDHKGEWQNFL